MSHFICNNFVGIREINPSFSGKAISAKDMQNVELYFTGENSGVGIRTQKGNVNIIRDLIPNDEKIINIFESIQNNLHYMFVHTVNEQEGKVYLFNNSELTLIIDGLSKTSVSEGIDYAQGYRDLFIFANGVDDLHYIEIGANPNHGTIQAVDSEARSIKGLGLANYAGRVWTFVDNRLHYCVTSDAMDWATSDSEVATSAGFIEFGKKITAIIPYIFSLAVFFEDSSVVISGDYPFTASQESPGGCAGYNALVFHGTNLFFYDETKKGIFSFQQVVLGNRTLGDNIALNIQSELKNIDKTRLNEIKMLSVNFNDRNEIWFLLPTSGTYSTIMIFDYIKQEWIKRKSQKLSSIRIFDNSLYSASHNKVLKEYQGNDFDGETIDAFYWTSTFNAGSNTTLKGCWYAPKICTQAAENNFWVSYVKDNDIFKNLKKKKISAPFKNYLEWNVSNWNEQYWYSPNSVKSVCKLPKPANFKTLELVFMAEGVHESFNIKNIEFIDVQELQT